MRYIASKLGSSLYPSTDPTATSLVEQVLEWQVATWQPLVAAAIQAGSAAIAKEGLQQLESWLGSSKGRFLAGNDFSIADICCLVWLHELETAGLLVEGYTSVKKWSEGLRARTSSS